MSVIYLDNNATTSVAPEVFESMIPFFTEKYGNASSMHTFGGQVGKSIQDAREKVAAMLGAQPEEIVFTSCGTESDSTAVMSALQAQPEKKHVITTRVEHSALIALGQHLEQKGYELTYLGVDSKGRLDLDELSDAMRKDTAIVSIMFANNETGTVFPIQKIAEMVKERGILFHTDAVQAAGHLHINVKEQNIDMLSLSGHKFHGPKGTGVLYARQGIPLTNVIEGGAQERGKRAGTENVPGIMGLAAALKEACDHIDENAAKVSALRDQLIAGLSQIPHSALNGDPVHRLPGNVNFCFEGIEGESLLLLLDEAGICASSGSACTSGSLDPSHVLLAIGRPHEVAHGSLRLTLCEENTEEQVNHMLREIPRVVEYLRSMSPVWKDLTSGKKQFML